MNPSVFLSPRFGNVAWSQNPIDIGECFLITDSFQQPREEVGLSDLLLIFHAADCAENLVYYLDWFFEKWHEVWHAFRDCFLVALFVAGEQLGDSLLDQLQIFVALEVRRQNPQKDDIADPTWFVDETLQH